MTDTNKYACEYFYYLLEKEESDFTLKVNLKIIKHISGIYNKPNISYIMILAYNNLRIGQDSEFAIF